MQDRAPRAGMEVGRSHRKALHLRATRLGCGSLSVLCSQDCHFQVQPGETKYMEWPTFPRPNV